MSLRDIYIIDVLIFLKAVELALTQSAQTAAKFLVSDACLCKPRAAANEDFGPANFSCFLIYRLHYMGCAG